MDIVRARIPGSVLSPIPEVLLVLERQMAGRRQQVSIVSVIQAAPCFLFQAPLRVQACLINGNPAQALLDPGPAFPVLPVPLTPRRR